MMTEKTKTQKEHAIETWINGESVEYTRHHFFQEVESKADYNTCEKGHLFNDKDTRKAAFKMLAKLRGVTPDLAYHWFHEIAAEMVEHYQEDYPALSDLAECNGTWYLELEYEIEKMSSLLSLTMQEAK